MHNAHFATDHGERDRMFKEINRKYANITTKAIELYKSLCEECQKKGKRSMTKGVVIKPNLTQEFSSSGHLIDLLSMVQSNYKWIMVYLNNNVSYPADVPTCTNNSGNLATLTDKTDIQIPLTTDNSQQNVSEPTQLDQQLRFIRTYSLSIFD